jgi:hypothetical protein
MHGDALALIGWPASRKNAVTDATGIAKPKLASPDSLPVSATLTPTTRPHASTSGPPLWPRAMSAVCTMVGPTWELRMSEKLPSERLGGRGRSRSSNDCAVAASTLPG